MGKRYAETHCISMARNDRIELKCQGTTFEINNDRREIVFKMRLEMMYLNGNERLKDFGLCGLARARNTQLCSAALFPGLKPERASALSLRANDMNPCISISPRSAWKQTKALFRSCYLHQLRFHFTHFDF
jgi:hypothetical protein